MQKKMASQELVRPLGWLEIFSSSRHSIGAFTCVANTCRYGRPSQNSGPLFVAHIESALARVIRELGALRIGIVGETTGKPCFTRIDSVDLRNHIQWKVVDSEAGLLGCIKDQHHALWQEVDRRPPWTIIVVEGLADKAVDIVFAVHHSLCDGKGTALFHARLLNALNGPHQPVPGLKGHILDLSDQKPIVAPSVEEMIRFSISWSFLFWALWADLAPSWLRPLPPWTGKATTMEPRQVNLRLITVPEASVAPLLAACRAEGTTLTGLLHALTLVSLSRRVPAAVATTFRSDTPISLLPFAHAPPGLDLHSILSDLNSAVGHHFDAQTVARFRDEKPQDVTEVWKVAGEVRATLKKRMVVFPKDDVLGLMSWVNDWNKRWLSKIGKPRDTTWSVSNIGSMRLTSETRGAGGSSWTLDRSIFSQPCKPFGPAIDLNVSGVEGRDITITVGWQESIVDTNVMEGLVEDLDAWLKKLSTLQQRNLEMAESTQAIHGHKI